MNATVRLYTKLSAAECLRRLGASGWAGEPKPHRWQPTVLDRDVFRIVKGRRFRLDARSTAFYALPPANSGLPRFFHGTVESQGDGARITGYYGVSTPLKVLSATVVAVVIFLWLITPTSRPSGDVAAPRRMLIVVAVYAAIVAGVLLLVLVGLPKVRPSQFTDRSAYFADFLARLLEATPINPS